MAPYSISRRGEENVVAENVFSYLAGNIPASRYDLASLSNGGFALSYGRDAGYIINVFAQGEIRASNLELSFFSEIGIMTSVYTPPQEGGHHYGASSVSIYQNNQDEVYFRYSAQKTEPSGGVIGWEEFSQFVRSVNIDGSGAGPSRSTISGYFADAPASDFVVINGFSSFMGTSSQSAVYNDDGFNRFFSLLDFRSNTIAVESFADGRVLVVGVPSVNDTGFVFGEFLFDGGGLSSEPFALFQPPRDTRTPFDIFEQQDGSFIFFWQQTGRGLKTFHAQAFDRNGVAIDESFSFDLRGIPDNATVEFANLASGDFVAVFTRTDGSGAGIKAQVFDTRGQRLGPELLVNTDTAGDKTTPHIAALENGGFVVSWIDIQGSIKNLETQIFEPLPATLFTGGTEVAQAAAELGSYDLIAVSPDDLSSAVVLRPNASGYMDLSSSLSGRSATVFLAPGENVLLYAGNNTVLTSSGSDTLIGNVSSDVFVGNGGNDAIDGGGGFDTAVYRGSILDYGFEFVASGTLQVTDLRAGSPDGGDTLTGIYRLRFADVELGAPDRIEVMADGLSNALGTTSRDFVYGNAGANSFRGGAGDDAFLAGAGTDTAIFSNLRSTYIFLMQNGLKIVASISEGFDVLSSVETVRYLDGDLSFDIAGTAAQMYRLYDSAFDRVPDAPGFNEWVDRLDGGTALGTVAAAFAGSAEFQSTYGNLTQRGFVEQLYRNVLGREGDAAGVNDWLAKLNAGTLRRADVLVGFSESAEHIQLLRAPVEAGLWDPRDATQTGTADADNLTGTAAGDYILGLAGNDTLFGMGGDDLLDGSAGSDEAVFGGLRRGATIERNFTFEGNLTSRTVSTSLGDGFDTLLSIEVFNFVDGSLVYDVADRAAVVYRLFDSAFDRRPDPIGFADAITRLEGGLSVDSLAESFVGSTEFQTVYGSLTDRQFVEQLYLNVLDRAGDVSGVNSWSSQLATGALTRGQVLVRLSESGEHIDLLRSNVEAGLWDRDETAASVARLYHAALERAPDALGLIDWNDRIDSGKQTLGGVADAFVASAEFSAKYGALTNIAYVEQLYDNVLDREPDEAGRSGWVQSLDSGRLDRGDVLLSFSDSLEYQYKIDSQINDGIVFT